MVAHLSVIIIRSCKDHCLRLYSPHGCWLQVAENANFPILIQKTPFYFILYMYCACVRVHVWVCVCVCVCACLCLCVYKHTLYNHTSETVIVRGTCISSRGIYLTRPLTTVRGCGSPTSISSTYRESASGCFWAFVMRPTRISSLLMEISASAGAETLGLLAADFLVLSFLPSTEHDDKVSELMPF